MQHPFFHGINWDVIRSCSTPLPLTTAFWPVNESSTGESPSKWVGIHLLSVSLDLAISVWSILPICWWYKSLSSETSHHPCTPIMDALWYKSWKLSSFRWGSTWDCSLSWFVEANSSAVKTYHFKQWLFPVHLEEGDACSFSQRAVSLSWNWRLSRSYVCQHWRKNDFVWRGSLCLSMENLGVGAFRNKWLISWIDKMRLRRLSVYEDLWPSVLRTM